MDLAVDLPLGSARLRTLTLADAPLVVAATRMESGRALWGARPVGPYSFEEASEALREWSLGTGRQISYGVVDDGSLVGAVGLMLDSDDSAELAYWVRPESRRQGIALGAVRALTGWVFERTGMTRVWLEINPDNVASLELAKKRPASSSRNICRCTADPGSARTRPPTGGMTV